MSRKIYDLIPENEKLESYFAQKLDAEKRDGPYYPNKERLGNIAFHFIVANNIGQYNPKRVIEEIDKLELWTKKEIVLSGPQEKAQYLIQLQEQLSYIQSMLRSPTFKINPTYCRDLITNMVHTLEMIEVAPFVARARKDKSDRVNAGKAPKLPKGIMATIADLLQQSPDATVKEMWGRLPDDPERRTFRIGDSEYDIYKEADSEKLCQENEKGQVHSVGFRRFEQLVSIAKKSQKK